MVGYDRDQVVGVSDRQLDEVCCQICHGVLKNPVMTTCCQQTYCSECITQWVDNKHDCPNDRKSLARISLRPVPRALRNIIDNFEIKCDYQSEGCPLTVTIGGLNSHLKICDFRPGQSCKECGLTRKPLVKHKCIESLLRENQNLKKELGESKDIGVERLQRLNKLTTKKEKDSSNSGTLASILMMLFLANVLFWAMTTMY